MSGHNLEKQYMWNQNVDFLMFKERQPQTEIRYCKYGFFLRSWFISFTCMFGEEYNIFYLIWWRNSLLSKKKTYWSSFILCAYVSTCMFALSLTLFYSKCYSDRLYFCGWIDFFWFWTVTAYTYNLGQINENAIFFIKRLYL